jgi:hypothetical protein
MAAVELMKKNDARIVDDASTMPVGALLFDSMERETGIEPATSSLGSCCLDSAQRKINCLEWVVYGQMRHYRRVLNTILNTSFK